MPRRAVMLHKLGSRDSPADPDVKRYLREFLGDGHVIDRPATLRRRGLLVNGRSIPFRMMPRRSRWL